MDLVDTIREKFAAGGDFGWWPIENQDAFVFKDSEIFGVAIP